jgi:hypothetical protein
MAKKNSGVNKSDEIRKLLSANPEIGPKDAVAKLAEKGIEISTGLFYFVKGHVKGRKARKKRAQKAVTKVSEFSHVSRTDAVTTILKVKAWAREVGGMQNLKALVEALCE